MKLNIFGSTGFIGCKTLNIIKNSYNNYKINLLCSNKNYKLLIKQVQIFKPKYVYINDLKCFNLIKKKINEKTKLLNFHELISYLNTSKSDYTILAISGYKSLYYLESILNNTKNLGIVNKECVVSAGHLFKRYLKKKNIEIYPIDSEHFSIYNFLNKNNLNNLKKIYLTASGGPFADKDFFKLKNVKFHQAIAHPKWKMGYKNSIDSATLVNKCLEVVEAHYLFNINYNNLDILIHKQSLVHSIIEYKNFLSQLIYFYNDMRIPLINFLKIKVENNYNKYNIFQFPKKNKLTFEPVLKKTFPIYDFFNKMDKSKPANIINFNIANEFAVNLYKKKHINYVDIYKIISIVTSFNLNLPTKTIKDVIHYHEEFEKYIEIKFSKF
ncbi:MAG: 1-deoxy-D-xylulose 5-phosphate reductoisomerase [Pelagibacteraceae bacterium]|nr:1-deoxy-D-xylulose 5-phosphate reductoisomerase [Pelagibacteraceae bacterium]|tara:strand:+ start:4329 stop:5477 length:1149 start_codon:yes stop_codon:yes gene_type:complete